PTTAHLHLFELGSPEWQAHILFRDYLIAHPQAAAQYEQLKQELAARFRTEREKYTDGKAEFIRGVVELAKQEQATAR
ncbi:MAG: GrpB family protein, partial [Anaerolineaceae bacterium]